MTEKIKKYLEFLKDEYNLSVTIHESDGALGGMGSLAPYNVHGNPYCLYIKSCCENWNNCINRQKKVIEKCSDGAFFGSCCYGVGEFVIPIKHNGNVLGFVSISGYKGDEKKRDHAAKKYGLSKEKTKRIYNKNLSGDIPDEKLITTLVDPLCAMLILRTMEKHSEPDNGGDYIYGHIVSILNTEYNKKLTIEQIAGNCHCSKSHISHLFKLKSGTTINRYLTEIRIKKAKALLADTDMSIFDAAYSCGFSDANYFIYVFKKFTGLPPEKYRKSLHH